MIRLIETKISIVGLTRPVRRAFTLTELLVVMVILILLTTMTVYAVNFTLAAERSRAAARQVQSYLAGARDRAIYEKHPVGVRFLIDSTVSGTSTSMIFIENVDPPPKGFVDVSHPSGSDWRATLTSGQPSWTSLERSGLLAPGIRIEIPAEGGFSYTIQSVDEINQRITFKPDFKSPEGTHSFELELPPVVRPNQEPMLLPRGIAIDINRSKLPSFWSTQRRDVMFSPRGTVTGRAAASGLIHFYLAELADVERLTNFPASPITLEAPHIPSEIIPASQLPSEPATGTPPLVDPVGDRVIVTVFPQTGAVSSHPVDVTDLNANGVADDPFRFAELGEVAGE